MVQRREWIEKGALLGDKWIVSWIEKHNHRLLKGSQYWTKNLINVNKKWASVKKKSPPQKGRGDWIAVFLYLSLGEVAGLLSLGNRFYVSLGVFVI